MGRTEAAIRAASVSACIVFRWDGNLLLWQRMCAAAPLRWAHHADYALGVPAECLRRVREVSFLNPRWKDFLVRSENPVRPERQAPSLMKTDDATAAVVTKRARRPPECLAHEAVWKPARRSILWGSVRMDEVQSPSRLWSLYPGYYILAKVPKGIAPDEPPW